MGKEFQGVDGPCTGQEVYEVRLLCSVENLAIQKSSAQNFQCEKSLVKATNYMHAAAAAKILNRNHGDSRGNHKAWSDSNEHTTK